MKTFEECKDEVAKARNCEDWEFMQAAYEGLAWTMEEGWLDRTISGAYLAAAELYAKSYALSCIEPSEEEISHAWSEWYKDNGGNNTQESWESAIAWYEQQINRK